MTPGLAGFVVAGGEPQWDDALDSVRAALAQAFSLGPERPSAAGGTRRRTWYDTFDWRLHQAGLLLEYVTAARISSTLVLTGPDGGGTAQPVTGWRTTRPYLFDQLPAGPVTDQVTRLVTPRALLPLVTVTSTSTVTSLLNEDGKTVARLHIERPVIAAGPAAKVALPPRLSIAEVRGYPGQARRAARAVALTPQVQPGTSASPDAALLSDALAAIGRRAGDYSNKVSARITADMSAAKAVATILVALLRGIQSNLDGVLRDTDTEYLHDLRVAVRRTRAAIKLLGEALRLPGDQADRFAAEFKWLGDVTTPVRDLDVHLLDFHAVAEQLAAATEDDLVPFRDFLVQRRSREFRAMARALRSARFTQLMDDWGAALEKVISKREAPVRSVKPARATGKPVATAGTLAADQTRVAFRKVARKGGAITDDSPAESLHDLRKRAKELRYALEFFAPLHDKQAYGAVLGDLKRLQDCLGDFQDTEVQIDEIRALAEAMLEAQAAPRGIMARAILAMGEITTGLAGRQAAARDAFARRFAGFADTEGQRRMTILLRGEA
jgi:CHAD domain-containing protein